MCGRYNVIDSPEVIGLLEGMGFDTSGMKPRAQPDMFNIAPTDEVLVAIKDEVTKIVREMRWWLTPHWAPAISMKYSMFNARAESIESSKAFAGPFRHRRAIVPASGYIEWSVVDGVKQPFYIRPESGYCFFAGIWDRWEKEGYPVDSCAIITTEASPSLKDLHPRQPVMLQPEQFDTWLDTSLDLSEIRPMLAPRELEGWVYYPISKMVGNARNKDGNLMEPTGPIKKTGDEESS